MIESSSGNVFADLGLPHPEELLVKADLAITITREIRRRGLSRKAAAALLGVASSDVANLIGTRISRYSIERLSRLLNALGRDVEIRVSPRRARKKPGHLRVVVR